MRGFDLKDSGVVGLPRVFRALLGHSGLLGVWLGLFRDLLCFLGGLPGVFRVQRRPIGLLATLLGFLLGACGLGCMVLGQDLGCIRVRLFGFGILVLCFLFFFGGEGWEGAWAWGFETVLAVFASYMGSKSFSIFERKPLRRKTKTTVDFVEMCMSTDPAGRVAISLGDSWGR